jgi:hypothetical protein
MEKRKTAGAVLGGMLAGAIVGALVFAPAVGAAKQHRERNAGRQQQSTGGTSQGGFAGQGGTSQGGFAGQGGTSQGGFAGQGGFGGPGGAGQGPGGENCSGKPGLEAAAEAIGIEESALAEELKGGRTLAEVAEEYGVDVETVIDAMVADATEHITKDVEEGRLTQEQADELLEGLEEHISGVVDGSIPPGPPGGMQGGAPGMGGSQTGQAPGFGGGSQTGQAPGFGGGSQTGGGTQTDQAPQFGPPQFGQGQGGYPAPGGQGFPF